MFSPPGMRRRLPPDVEKSPTADGAGKRRKPTKRSCAVCFRPGIGYRIGHSGLSREALMTVGDIGIIIRYHESPTRGFA